MTRVLLVDDDPGIRRALAYLFEKAGFACSEAATAEAALAPGVAEGVDAVVCDVMMPGTDGFAIHDAMLARVPRLQGRFVFLTGVAGEAEVQAAAETRGAELIDKLADLHLAVDVVRLAVMRG